MILKSSHYSCCKTNLSHGSTKNKSRRMSVVLKRVVLVVLMLSIVTIFMAEMVSALKTSQESITALHHLYQSMDGDNWNHDVVNSTFPGRKWDFRQSQVALQNEEGASRDTAYQYIVDPCGKFDQGQEGEESLSFMGLQCECSETSCHVRKVHIALDASNSNSGLVLPITSQSDRDRYRGQGSMDITEDIRRARAPVRHSGVSSDAIGSDTTDGISIDPIQRSTNILKGSLPDSLCTMTELTYLYMESANGPIPSCIGEMLGLEFVQLSQSGITGTLPEGLCDLQNLGTLELSHNDLRGPIPNCLGNLNSIMLLYLGGNQLTGTIPATFANMPELWKLSLSQNHLEGEIPIELGSSPNLGFLDLSENKLMGSIPSQLGDLNEIYYIGLSNNFLSGAIPTAFDQLDTLEYVEIRSNQLTGGFPECFLNTHKLQALDLSDNKLTGSLPAALGDMTHLTLLSLLENKFSGELPREIGALVGLKNLLLGINEISGSIPDEIGNMVALEKLHLMFNRFTGKIPDSITNLIEMTDFKIFKNDIQGELPPHIRDWSKLQYFQVGGNLLSGSMDVFDKSKMSDLKVIDLGGNAFTGQLPAEIFDLPSLRTFAAPKNCLSGSLPENICNAVNLEHLIISSLTSGEGCRLYFVSENSNTFTGFEAFEDMIGLIPSCLYNLPELQTLYAAGNSFLGELPDVISPKLLELDVSGNRLNGKLPDSLALSNLEIMYINNNRITGTLDPFDLGNITKYESKNFIINATVNQLSGNLPGKFFDVPPNQLSILNGNTFQCDIDSPLPLNDPYSDQYLCGSSQFDILFGFIVFVICMVVSLVAFVWYYRKRHGNDYWVYKFVRRVRYWFAVGRHSHSGHAFNVTTKNVLNNRHGEDNREVLLYHTLRYSEYWESLRSVMTQTSYVLVGLLLLYLSMANKEYRSIEFTYLWASTCAYLSGTESVYLLSLCWIVALFCIRYFIKQDKVVYEKFDKKYLVQKKNSDKAAENFRLVNSKIVSNEVEEESGSGILIPMLRMVAIILLSVGLVSIANILYLYVLLHYNASAIAAANLALTVFKLAWDYVILPVIFTAKPFMFGVEEKEHDKFIDAYFGGKLNVLFITNVFLNFFVPILCIMFADPACFNGVVVAASEVKTTYNVPECSNWLVFTGGCTEEVQSKISIGITAPFVYNHTCASSILKTFVPIYMSMQVFIGLKVFMYIFSLMYETREATLHEQEAIEMYRNSKIDKIPSPSSDPEENSVRSSFDTRRLAQQAKEAAEEIASESTKTHHEDIFSYFAKSDEEIQKDLAREKAIAEHKNVHDSSIRRVIMDLINSVAPGGRLFMVRHASRKLFSLQYDTIDIDNDPQWLEIIVTIHMGNLVILFTYGILAPLLGFSIVATIILETYAAQTIVGRFIAQHSDILSYARDPEALKASYNLATKEPETNGDNNNNISDSGISEYDAITANSMKFAPPSIFTEALTEAVREADEPYGAISVLQEAEKQLDMLPSNGIMYMGRRLFLFSAGVVFAMTINDVYFNLPDAKVSYAAQLIVLLSLPVYDMFLSSGKKLALWLYPEHFAHKTGINKQFDSAVENEIATLHSQSPMHIAHAARTGNETNVKLEVSEGKGKGKGKGKPDFQVKDNSLNVL